jgi:hypothetical protein
VSNLQGFNNDGIEIYIDTKTGESFASVSGYARMANKAQSTISERLQKYRKNDGSAAEVLTVTGVKTVRLINEDQISGWLPKDNPAMATKLLKLGIRGFLHELAGFKVSSTAVKPEESRIEVRQQQPQLSIQEAKEVIADFRLNHALAVSTGNVRLQQQMEVAIAQYTDVFLLAGLPQNPLLGGQPAGSPINMRFEGVVDVAIRLGFKIPSGYESSLGNHVGKTLAHLRVSINDERLKDYRFNLASGKRVPAFMYPAFNKEIEASVTEYCTKKGFPQNSKHLASA